MIEFCSEARHRDYDLAYRGETALGEQLPWDIPGPQPAFVDIERAGLIRGAVLDCGCGTGENALFLASKGYAVTGVDLAPTAISRARQKSAERAIDVAFAVADALELAGYEECFDTVVDSGMAHVFGSGELPRYAAALHHACRPDAVLFVLGIDEQHASGSRLSEAVSRLAEDEPGPGARTLPMIDEDSLREAFADGWTVGSIGEANMRAVLPHAGRDTVVPALLAQFVRV
ncbi:Methyltransferase domain-containing protein [Amycolatopsis pretoriensis]|uniref:Methyltransferase domain-containing protein n=1 Tax=Amycolatopsis pretoriensis TaxID=218821 RepID=A0A1H5QK26_9PSEU|nr:class I SAM-dependent methyltransferase [Amycolatopsis pretoriensis]SEF26522.1 Methyltransferase domain-containing protein [Amycolatopsis pretoriensis]